jgi:hypothetical protein
MRVFTCRHCSRIHLEVGHTQIHFASEEELAKYLEFLDSIDVSYYAAINEKKGLSRVIILPIDHCSSAHLSFTRQEFETFKEVIRAYLSKKQQLLSFIVYN